MADFCANGTNPDRVRHFTSETVIPKIPILNMITESVIKPKPLLIYKAMDTILKTDLPVLISEISLRCGIGA